MANSGFSTAGLVVPTTTSIIFYEKYPQAAKDENRNLFYLPFSYNFPAIDGIIVIRGLKKIEPDPPPRTTRSKKSKGKEKAEEEHNDAIEVHIIPIQVTFSGREKHSDSETHFFNHYNQWITALGLQDRKVKFTFLWIVLDKKAIEVVGGRALVTRSGTRDIPAYTRATVTFKDCDHQLGEALERAEKLRGNETMDRTGKA
jgi:hypothetical protein